MIPDEENVTEEIEKEYLGLLHGLMTRTFLQCQQEGISQIEMIRLVYMNTLYVLVDHSNVVRMPHNVFMELVEKAYQTVKEVQEKINQRETIQ